MTLACRRVDHRKRWTAPVALAFACAALSCADPTGPPAHAIRFTPPGWYRALYEHDVRCSGRTRPFDALQWYWVPGAGFSYDGQRDAGLTESSPGRIFIAETFLSSPMVLRHEMLHAILRRAKGHPPAYFNVRCPLMWSNYYASSNARARWVDDSILQHYEKTHAGSLDLPGD
jgi:hypothetical protein